MVDGVTLDWLYNIALAALILAGLYFRGSYVVFKEKVSQIGDLMDRIEEALLDDKISREEILQILEAAKAVVGDEFAGVVIRIILGIKGTNGTNTT